MPLVQGYPATGGGGVVATSSPPSPPDFFVSATGGTGTGSISDPWSLAYAFSGASGVLVPGKTVALRGGVYGTGGPGAAFSCTVAGTPLLPIKFQNFAGERVIINGAVALGQYTWLQGTKRGFVIRNTNHTTAGQDRGVSNNVGSKVINVIIHDMRGGGIDNFQDATNAEVTGNIIFNCGRTVDNQSHGIYTTTLAAETERLLQHNVVFNNSNYGFHCFASGSQLLQHVHLLKNVAFNNSCITVFGSWEADYLLGTDNQTVKPPLDITIRNCYSYRNLSTLDQAIGTFGAVDIGLPGGDLTIEDNYFVGHPRFISYKSLIMRRNTWYNMKRLYLDFPASAYTSIDFNNNRYFHRSSEGTLPFRVNSPSTEYADLAAWQAGQGLDVIGSTFSSSLSGVPASGQDVFVIPNPYEAGRGIVIVYNWTGAAQVTADLSSILGVGDSYEVYNVQAIHSGNSYGDGASVASGIFVGSLVSLPMSGVTAPSPLDRVFTTPPVTGPTFNVFLVHR